MRRKLLTAITTTITTLAAMLGLLAAGTGSAQAATTACSAWVQVKPNVWAADCIQYDSGSTRAWAEIRNYSAVDVYGSFTIYMKDEAFAYFNCGGGIGWSTKIPAMSGGSYGWLQCSGYPWRFVSAPRYARTLFQVDTVNQWVNTPQI